MDAVITYVNGLDPEWQRSYAAVAGEPVLEKRYRDWGTLRYLFRALEKFTPFFEKIHLVVASESQVPEWVNCGRVHVVLHSEIIPEEYLPCFSASMIEMFLHRIPGLAEQYVYFNDDLFPVRPMKESAFFREGRAVKKLSRELLALNDFKHLAKDSDRLARAKAGAPRSLFYLRPQHTCTPFLRSRCEELFAGAEKEITASLTRTRKRGNFNQYLFSDYIFFKGDGISERMSGKHFSLAVADAARICAFLRNPDRDMVCINDVQMSEERYKSISSALLETFSEILPEKSVYEA